MKEMQKNLGLENSTKIKAKWKRYACNKSIDLCTWQCLSLTAKGFCIDIVWFRSFLSQRCLMKQWYFKRFECSVYSSPTCCRSRKFVLRKWRRCSHRFQWLSWSVEDLRCWIQCDGKIFGKQVLLCSRQVQLDLRRGLKMSCHGISVEADGLSWRTVHL